METPVNRPPFKALPRLAIAIVAHLFLIAWFVELSLWRSLEHQAWKQLRVGSVAAIALVFTVPVMVRGTQEQKVAGTVLSLLPAYCLVWAVLGALLGA